MKKNEMSSGDISIISDCVKIEGKLFSEGNVNIDGNVKGEINVNGDLILGEKAMVSGNVTADNITLMGKVEGTIYAKEKLVLEGKSFLKGDLNAKVLVIEAGAKFEGQSNMAASVAPNVLTKPEQKKDEKQ